jgi:AraC-like DNA-binding protein
MGAPSLVPFPHHSWLGYWEHVPADEPLVVIHRRQVAHCLMYLPAGRIFVRSFHRGQQAHFEVTSGSVSFSPADGHRRTIVGEHNPAHDYFTLLIPRQAVGLLAESEGVIWTFDELNCFVSPDDAVLRWCMERLSVPPSGTRELQLRKDEAARRLLFHLQELGGGDVPDWQADGSVFTRAEMQHFVDYIDAHLRLAPTLCAMALVAALSPSHFAKKFRQSTGVSLQRFINRRRILASIPVLQANSDSLAGISLDFGFSSQSHFTRLFSEMTGMTPAKYRKQFRRTVGWRASAATATAFDRLLNRTGTAPLEGSRSARR